MSSIDQNKINKLTLERRVAGDTGDEGSEDVADTDTSTSETDGRETSTVHLGSGDDGSGGRLNDDAARLDGAAHHARGKSGTAAVEEEAIVDHGLASDERAGDAG